MKALRERANPLQRAPQKCRQVYSQSRLRQAGALEGGLMIARQNPGFVRNPRRIGSNRDIIPARLNHTRRLPLLLAENVAEDTALFGHKIFAPRPQLVEHSPRHEHRRGDLRSRVAELLPRSGTVTLK